jgi:GxxExxY protein
MDTNKLLLKEEVFQIVGCAIEVLNELGCGLHEKPYENALTVEFKKRGFAFDQQRRFEILYKGEHVGELIPDLIVFGSVIVDTKVVESITDIDRAKMINYLRISHLRVGVILNFKNPKLEWERIVV